MGNVKSLHCAKPQLHIPQPRRGPSDPEPRLDQWWIEKHESFVANSIKNRANINVLFYGDSLIEGWMGPGAPTSNQYYAPMGTAIYGIAGDRTEHLLYRIADREVEGLNPRLCVLQIGTNNLCDHTDEAIAQGVLDVVDLLKNNLPTSMKILLLGILPRTSANGTARVDNINSIIRAVDNGDTVRYFSLRDLFYPNEEFNPDLYNVDLLHLSARGYEEWARYMDPIFREMLHKLINFRMLKHSST